VSEFPEKRLRYSSGVASGEQNNARMGATSDGSQRIGFDGKTWGNVRFRKLGTASNYMFPIAVRSCVAKRRAQQIVAGEPR
jgi:hypothetical protein